MLEWNGDKDKIPSTVTSRIREVLARNIAARNHGLSPLQFTGAVTTLHSSLIAARLLEEAGFFRTGSVETETRVKGNFTMNGWTHGQIHTNARFWRFCGVQPGFPMTGAWS